MRRKETQLRVERPHSRLSAASLFKLVFSLHFYYEGTKDKLYIFHIRVIVTVEPSDCGVATQRRENTLNTNATQRHRANVQRQWKKKIGAKLAGVHARLRPFTHVVVMAQKRDLRFQVAMQQRGPHTGKKKEKRQL